MKKDNKNLIFFWFGLVKFLVSAKKYNADGKI